MDALASNADLAVSAAESKSEPSSKRARTAMYPGSVLTSTLEIPLSQLSSEQLGRIQERFSIRPPENPRVAGGPPIPLVAADVIQGNLLVPRFAGYHEYGCDTLKIERGEPIALNFAADLDPTRKQDQAAAAISKWAENAPAQGIGGVLRLPPGFGKTVLACWTIAHLKVKTMVIVNSTALFDQWVARLESFLPGIQVGQLRRDKMVTAHKHVVVAMLQSLALKQTNGGYPASCFDGIGLVVVDEVHKACAPTMNRSLRSFPMGPRYILGLSATPKRADGFHAFLDWSFGREIYGLSQESRSTIVFQLRMEIPKLERKEFWINKAQKKMNTAKMITRMAEDPTRNEFLVWLVHQAFLVGRRSVVLSDRVAHLELLCKAVSKHVEGCIIFTGKKRQTQEALENSSVIFASYGVFREGVDVPNRDTLITATPVSSMEQAVGRIQRKHPDKKEPLVLDVWDQFSMYANQGNTRARFYRKACFNIRSINVTAVADPSLFENIKQVS